MTDVGNDAAVALPFEEWPPEQPYYIPYEDWGDANLKLTSHIAQIGWERQSSWSPYYSQPIPVRFRCVKFNRQDTNNRLGTYRDVAL
jgi:hypothetical protein